MSTRFQTQTFGKWVLVGEHSVLRGAVAVALPQRDFRLKLTFEPGAAFSIEPREVQTLVEGLLLSLSERLPLGHLTIESSIPMGAGMGSSAALCVALTRWMSQHLLLPEGQVCELATGLEHQFHGKSSGMDVAVIHTGEPITFAMGRGPQPLGVKKIPLFTFHDTGIRSRTSDCVSKVEQFRTSSPVLAKQVDDAMGEASRLAVEGLIQYDLGQSANGLQLIQQAMQKGRECFLAWDLVPEAARRLEERILRQGALAVKITGAGGGGMVVALWPDSLL